MRRTESRSKEYIPEDKLRELERKRKQWKKEQELMREHEKRKAKMIAEYEERRARELGLKKRRRRSRSRSKSRSRSHTSSRRRTRSRSRSRSKDRARSSHVPSSSTSSARIPVMSEKCDASSSNTPLFKGSEGKKINTTELKKIKVNIQRDIASSSEDTPKELLRDIVSPDEIVVKRREGEGSKPIFEREELKHTEATKSEVAERRTIVAVETAERSEKRRTSSRRSRSQSSERYRSHSSRRSARYQSTKEVDSGRYGESYKRDGSRGQDIARDTFHPRMYHSDQRFHGSMSRDAPSRFYQDSGVRRHPEDGEYPYTARPGSEASSYRRNDSLPYHESMAFPMYYDNFVRPMMMDPLMMIRAPVPMVRARMPPMMNTYRAPPRPRLAASDMYRFNVAPSQRYNRMF